MMRSLALLFMVLGLAGCASNQALFARYSHSCPALMPSVAMTLASATAVASGAAPDNRARRWEPAVYFGFDRADLDASAQARLARNLQVLERHPRWRVSVRAYADRIGNPEYNRSLSERRLHSVVAWLHQAGLAPSRIMPNALGEYMPILPNADRRERTINRRVELLLLDEQGRPVRLRTAAGAGDRFSPPVPVK